MEDVVHVQGVADQIEVKAMIARAEAKKGLSVPVEAPEGLPGVVEIRSLEAADGLNNRKLGERLKLV